MSTSNVTIRMDKELKKQAEELFNDLGLNMTTAITAFAKQAVREQRIPFTLSRNIPNAETIKAIDAIERGEGLSREFHSVKDLMDDLNAED